MALCSTTMALFDVLPMEIFLIIMEKIPDFVSMDNFIEAFPRSAAIFMSWAILSNDLATRLLPRNLNHLLVFHLLYQPECTQLPLLVRQSTYYRLSAVLTGQDPSEVAAIQQDMVYMAA